MAVNEVEHRRWNMPEIAETWQRRERLTTTVTAPLLARLAPREGERVLEIGSGGGLAAIEAAKAVGHGGSVTGFDLSEALVALATRRASDAGMSNVRFVHGDSQVDDIPGGPFDAVMSQFGVMFFADPVAAFSNIRGQMRAGGRMVFACWQGAAENNWYPSRIIAKYAKARPTPTVSGGPPSGPFAFADPAYVRNILERAGFRDISHESFSQDVAVTDDTVADPERLQAMGLAGDQLEAARGEMDALTESMRGSDGLLHFTLAPQFIAAKNPA
jgi:ubiquinone/menaquinone biosynthesis C-methylase UbiE